MKPNRFFILALTLASFAATPSQADVVLTHSGQASGYVIKVVTQGTRVAYQLFDHGNYVKNLGDQKDYEISKVVRYSESLPAQIKSDKTRKTLYKVGGGIVGLAGGIIATKLIAGPKEGGGMFSGLGQALVGMIAVIPCTVGGTLLGWWGGSKIHDVFFVGAERHELRAILTSAALIENSKAVLEVDSPLAAASELDLALKELVTFQK